MKSVLIFMFSFLTGLSALAQPGTFTQPSKVIECKFLVDTQQRRYRFEEFQHIGWKTAISFYQGQGPSVEVLSQFQFKDGAVQFSGHLNNQNETFIVTILDRNSQTNAPLRAALTIPQRQMSNKMIIPGACLVLKQ